jgi:hypothetical protein
MITDLANNVSETQRIAPNIVTLTANLGQCSAIMTTGVRPSPPDLKDIGAGLPPRQDQDFYPPARTTPSGQLRP